MNDLPNIGPITLNRLLQELGGDPARDPSRQQTPPRIRARRRSPRPATRS
ncbi:MAG: hypothetical protein WDM96_02345 [Lacunisphaera sp.]